MQRSRLVPSPDNKSGLESYQSKIHCRNSTSSTSGQRARNLLEQKDHCNSGKEPEGTEPGDKPGSYLRIKCYCNSNKTNKRQ